MIRKFLYKAFSALGSKEVKLFDRASENCQAAQWERLRQMIESNAETAYGKAHGFGKIKSAQDFQKALPVNTYDDLSPYIDRMTNGEKNVLTAIDPFMFATTSGTTGARKYIPINTEYVKEFRRASVVSGYNMLKSFPAVARGVTLSIFSPAEEGRTPGGLPYGAISGRLYLDEPKLIKKYVSPLPYELFLIKDYEARYYSILRAALMLPIATIYTLNPSTIALLGRRLKTYASALIKDIANGTLTPPGEIPPDARMALSPYLRPNTKRAHELQKLFDSGNFRGDLVWPNLALISCWTKASAAFYLQDFPDLYGETPVCDITYGASEGRGTVCLGPDKQALSIRSHFFEFIEDTDAELKNPKVYQAHELQIGRRYLILFTTSSGLFRYNINDVVKVVGFHNTVPLLEFLHKSGNVSSFTGEKLTETHVTRAVKETANQLGLSLQFFTVIPTFKPEPHYSLWMECADQGRSIDLFKAANILDTRLGECNTEYGTKRDSKRLASPTVSLLLAGTYESLRKSLVASGVPDAQVKVTHLNPKEDIKNFLEPNLLAQAALNSGF